MLKIEIDATELIAKFGTLQQHLNDLKDDMPREFMNWQREDMHRKWPKEEGAGLSVSTEIFSRGARRRSRQRRRRGLRTGVRRVVRLGGGAVHRPILRPELFDRLSQRMKAMAETALKWP